MPLDFIHVLEENPMEAIDQGAASTSQVGDNVVEESRGPYPSHSPPFIQQPSQVNTLFHSPIEGHVDDTTHPDYGPNAPFWDTSIGKAITSFGTSLNFSEEVSLDEEECRQYHAAILHAQEIEKKIDDILGTPLSRSAAVPVGYRSLADSMRPIESILDCIVTPHKLGQTSNPTASHIMSVPNPHGSSAFGVQHSIPISSSPSSAGGKPPT